MQVLDDRGSDGRVEVARYREPSSVCDFEMNCNVHSAGKLTCISSEAKVL